MRLRSSYLLCSTLILAVTMGAGARSGMTVGKKPGQIKGRWLEVKALDQVREAKGVFIGEVVADIQWKRERNEAPIDEDLLAEKIQEQLGEKLRSSGVLGAFHDEAPSGDSAGVIRLDCSLVVEPGSRAARYAIGFGAGKSRSIFEIHLVDHSTGEELGLYHGYGTGSGMGFKLAGGGARKMTQDDIQENAKKFIELLDEVR